MDNGFYYNEAEVMRVINDALVAFYNSLLAKISSVNIRDILKRKNTYLYRAKGYNNAADIVDSILSAFISSSEETIFGNCFFEPLAIVASGGFKSTAEGIDLEYRNRNGDNAMYAVAVKSGPSVFNADSKKRQEQNFANAGKKAQQARMAFIPIIGYSYGKKRTTGGADKPYYEFAGQRFWYEITGDPNFYQKIILYMGNLPETYAEQFNEAYAQAANRMIRDFTNDFCDQNGRIIWDLLVYFNSGDDEMNGVQ